MGREIFVFIYNSHTNGHSNEIYETIPMLMVKRLTKRTYDLCKDIHNSFQPSLKRESTKLCHLQNLVLSKALNLTRHLRNEPLISISTANLHPYRHRSLSIYGSNMALHALTFARSRTEIPLIHGFSLVNVLLLIANGTAFYAITLNRH